MSVPAFKNSKAKVRRRRSHHALKKVDISVCPNCKAPALPHIVCKGCGQYKGRQVIGGMDAVEKTLEKKVVKKAVKEEKSK